MGVLDARTATVRTTGRLAGKTALVTGGSRGIGRGIAERLAREGARVAVHYGGNETAAKETVTAIEAAGGEAFAIGRELGTPGDAAALWAAFDEAADGLDILVNNAGTGRAGRSRRSTRRSTTGSSRSTRRRRSSWPSRAWTGCGTGAGSSTSRRA